MSSINDESEHEESEELQPDRTEYVRKFFHWLWSIVMIWLASIMTWTAVAAVATVILAIFACEAWQEAKRATKAINGQINQMKKDSEDQLRAYVIYDTGVLDKNGTLQVTIINEGQTPAFNVSGACKMAFRERQLRTPSFDFPKTDYLTIDIAPRHATLINGCAIRNNAPPNSDPSRVLYAWGLVNYTDIYQGCQHAAFIARQETSGEGRLTALWQSASHPNDDCDYPDSQYRKAKWRRPDWLPDFDQNSGSVPPSNLR